MSIKLMSLVWENGPTSSTDRFVLLALADNANDQGRCWPSYQTIAAKCAMSRRTVINTVERLIAAGYISRRGRGDGHRQTSNEYILNAAKLSTVVIDVHRGSEADSLPVVNDDHWGGEQDSPGVVNDVHRGSDRRSPDPSMNLLPEPPMNHQQKQQQATVCEVATAAAWDGNGMGEEVLEIMRDYGVALNETTKGLLDLEPDYVEAHLSWAQRHDEKAGLAIRRILDGDPAPGQRNLRPYIPPEWADVVNR